MGGAHGEERPLQVRAGVRCAGAVVCEQGAQRPEPAPAGAVGHDSPHRGDVEDLQAVGGLPHALQAGAVEDLREVEERAGHGGDREAVARRDVVGRQRRPMDPQPLRPAPAAGHRDLQPLAAPHVPQGAGAVMAQRRAGTGGEDGGVIPAVPRQARMADRVDAAKDGVQPPLPDPRVDPATRQPELEQLRTGDDAAAGRCEGGEAPIQMGCATFALLGAVNVAHVGHAATMAPPRRAAPPASVAGRARNTT